MLICAAVLRGFLFSCALKSQHLLLNLSFSFTFFVGNRFAELFFSERVITRNVRCTTRLFIRRCLEQLLHTTVPDRSWTVATLPLAMGGLGLRSASRGRKVSFWSSWADVLHMIRQRHPLVAEFMLETLGSDDPGHFHLQGAADARSRLEDMGFRAPEWRALVDGARPLGFPDPDDVGPRHCGWQRVASQHANSFFMSTAVWPRLLDASRALLRCQDGPLAGIPFSCCPSSFHSRFAHKKTTDIRQTTHSH